MRIPLFIFLGFSTACGDGTAGDEDPGPEFQEARIFSAYPAMRQPDGTWARVCGRGPPDGIITNVVYLSSQRGATVDLGDHDVSLRPHDVIDGRVIDGGLPGDIDLSSTGNVGLRLDCITPANTSGSGCDGAAPSVTLDSIRYVAHTPSRGHGHNVMLLIDQSGSIGGIVRDGTFQEERIPDSLPSNFGEVASDRTGLRFAAARRLVAILDDDDHFGAMGFGENVTPGIPCTDPMGDVPPDFSECFGTGSRDSWATNIDALSHTTGGRSNLWLAVKTAYEHLRGMRDTQRSNHVVVLTDGPDTCAGENRLACATSCITADYDAFVDQLEADASDPIIPRIQIHFVQFESLGYPGRDARQVEVSCLSGGHYQYVNSNQFPGQLMTEFQEALETAVTNVGFSLMGYWELAASVPAYKSNDRVPPGSLYGLEGALTIRPSSRLVAVAEEFPFGVGLGQSALGAVSWDRRPTLRKPCESFVDCGAVTSPGACEIVCSPETMLCANGADPAPQPDLASCDAGRGFCCGATCRTSGACDACAIP